MPITSTPPPDARAEDIFFRTRVAFGARAFRDDAASPFVHPISEEETANPVRPPSGFNFFGIGIAPPKGMELPGILGDPKLAITYAFGLAIAPIPANSDASTENLETVGSVRVTARVYDVRLSGEEAVDGYPCFHLRLAPLGNPGRYRLRDLCVDESTYQTRQLVTDGNFTSKETGSGKWIVSYKQIGDAWYLSDEVSQDSISDAVGKFDHIDVQFFNIVADPRADTLR